MVKRYYTCRFLKENGKRQYELFLNKFLTSKYKLKKSSLMTSFLFFSSRGGYYKYMVDAVLAEPNTKVFQPITNRIALCLYRLHFAWPMNKYIELPFKRIWFKRLLKGMDVNKDDSVYVIMNENSLLSYSQSFLTHLKKVYPGCKICFFFSNPVDSYILPKLSCVDSFYDAKITFFEEDALKYGLEYTELCPYKLPYIENVAEIKSDVFFVGRDKGRLDFLINLYENLTSKGLVCDFNIMGVKEVDMKYNDKIKYNRWMKYDEVLRHVNSTRCVLEVLQDMKNYVSIKTYESLQYHKKLITTNSTIEQRAYYNPKIIKIVSDPSEDICDFVFSNTDENEFSDGIKYTSFKYFESYIEALFQKKGYEK